MKLLFKRKKKLVFKNEQKSKYCYLKQTKLALRENYGILRKWWKEIKQLYKKAQNQKRIILSIYSFNNFNCNLIN